MTLRVAVAGAGVGGCAAAMLLARQGHAVTLFEQAPSPGPVGAGLLLHPSGVAALERLGVAERVLSGAEPIRELVADHLSGGTLSRLEYASAAPAAVGYGVERGALFTALFDAALEAGVVLRAGVRIVGRRESAQGVDLVDDSGLGHGPFDFAIAADGSRSLLRDSLGGATVAEYRHGALWMSGGCAGVRGRLQQVVDGTRCLLGILPTGGGRASLFWGVARDRIDALRAAGFAALRREIERFAPMTAELLERLDGFESTTFATYRRVRLARWSDPTLVVVGDAAHAMSPHLGQGANLALGDAVALADALADARSGATEPAVAFRSFERVRRPIARRYALFSLILAPFFQSEPAGLALPRDLALPLLTGFGPTRRLMARILAGVVDQKLHRADTAQTRTRAE